ncbi:uncharacterized protein AC631_03915, partial [Debaryomyces fabryi]
MLGFKGFLLALALVQFVAAITPSPCKPLTSPSLGFNAVFYPYKFRDDTTLRDLTYMNGGYKASKPIALASGITDINFAIAQGNDGIVKGNIYGKAVTVSNFSVELTGYFLAPETGDYQLLLSVDDGALVTFGAGQAFGCCNTLSTSNDGNYALFAHWYSTSSSPGATLSTQHLTAGYYYPIKIFYVNMQNPMSMTFKVTTPSGTVITNFNNVYSFTNTDTSCPAVRPTTTVTKTWSSTNTKTTTNTATAF